MDLVLPYWQAAGYTVDLNSDRSWLEQLAALIGPSLTRLSDAVEESRQLFGETVTYQEDASPCSNRMEWLASLNLS